MKISVILCTHNPRADHFARTLAALQSQTLPAGEWELLVVDNASAPPVELPATGLAPVRARVVCEPVPGLVAARLRGIAEAAGALLVWVDDDNVLAPDYLARATKIAERWPALGAFGGQIHAECEVPPTPWFAARLDRLAIREFPVETRSARADLATAPCGAGLCVRTDVARHYRARALGDPARRALGHQGAVAGSGDDFDLAFTAHDLGLEVGRFPALELIHLIPRERLTLRYFARLTRAQAQGTQQLLALHHLSGPFSPPALAARWAHWKWSVVDILFSLFPLNRPNHATRRDHHPHA